jgi:hypothetical protein
LLPNNGSTFSRTPIEHIIAISNWPHAVGCL